MIALSLLLLATINFSSGLGERLLQQETKASKSALLREETFNALNTLSHNLCPGDEINHYNDTLDPFVYGNTYPPLPYHNCNENSTLNIIPFFGGMTNGLKFVMLGALMSFHSDRCFVVTEQKAHLNPGHKNGTNSGMLTDHNFIHHFFEGIGLSQSDPFVRRAISEGRYRMRRWDEYWYDGRSRHMKIVKYTNKALGYNDINGHILKRDFLHRMWQLRPQYRQNTCDAIRLKHGLLSENNNKYIAYSIRRGDKEKEAQFPSMSIYIEATEFVLKKSPYFRSSDGITPISNPTIFVATDDCTVIMELRILQPEWNFLSECTEEQIYNENLEGGYNITSVPQWTPEQREEHFQKFFIELYALALAPTFIGVSYTNVAWWVYFMRPPQVQDNTFLLLDEPGLQGREILPTW